MVQRLKILYKEILKRLEKNPHNQYAPYLLFSFWNQTDSRIDSLESELPDFILDIIRNEVKNTLPYSPPNSIPKAIPLFSVK